VDAERESYERKYQDELIEQLRKMIAQVDQKIKRSIQRAENGPQGRHEPSDVGNQHEMNAL
jgi:polyhydroxyalkanoate synthesis regulator phasin